MKKVILSNLLSRKKRDSPKSLSISQSFGSFLISVLTNGRQGLIRAIQVYVLSDVKLTCCIEDLVMASRQQPFIDCVITKEPHLQSCRGFMMLMAMETLTKTTRKTLESLAVSPTSLGNLKMRQACSQETVTHFCFIKIKKPNNSINYVVLIKQVKSVTTKIRWPYLVRGTCSALKTSVTKMKEATVR